MAGTKRKRKGGKKPAQYSGALGKFDHDLPPIPPRGTVLFGSPSDAWKRRYEQELRAWLARQVARLAEGLPLLFAHYGLEGTREDHLLLAIALARDHVPYFMPPRPPRGRPPSAFSKMVPILAKMADGAARVGMTQARIFEIAARESGLDVESVIREVKRHRSRVGKTKRKSPTR